MKRTRTLRSFSFFHRIVAVVLAATIPLATLPEAALALPHGGVVSKGQATLGYATGRLLVTQATSSATFNWGSFTVKSGQSVVYRTPGASSVSLNYIGGTTPSSINGAVTSNGILEFMNPNGLIFGSGSVVSAAGVMAFGSATPWGKPTGAVTNAGTLTATTGGTVALVGTAVTNSGTITAPGGEVLLAAGSTVTPILTTGGSSLSVATTGGGLVDDSGIVSAETGGGKTGTILLQSGMGSGTTTLESTAVLDASAPNGGNGGAITVNGYKVVLNEIAPLNVSAPAGIPGTVTIDPTITDVGTPSALEAIDSSQSTYLNNSNVCIALTANINLATGTTLYNWLPLGTSSSSPFTGTFNGNGYKVRGYTIGTSSSSPCGGNDVGFIGSLGSSGVVKNLGVYGTIYASGCNVGGVVGNNFGTVEYSYNKGTVTGTDNSIGGVVGYNGGTVEYSYNTGNVNVSGSSVFTGNDVGGVVGYNYLGTVEYSYNTGTVKGGSEVGGIVGLNSGTGAKVEYSYNTGSVSGSGDYVGGVVGDSNGTVESSYNTGTVSGSNYVGGVVGYNGGTVEYSYYNSSIYTGSTIGSGTTTGSDIGGITTADFGTSSYFTRMGTFNTFSSGAFSSTTDPWFMGTVTYTNGSTTGTITAPILVSDLPTATVTGNSGTSVYSGSTVSPGYTTTYTMGASAIPTEITVSTSIGPNANSYTVTPTVKGTLPTPTTQTSVGLVTAASGTWTISQAPLTFTGSVSNPTKIYDGTSTLTLTTSNSSATLSGFVNGQGATYMGATGSYMWSHAGDVDLSVTLNTGNFSPTGSGFSWSNYTVPVMKISGKGTITPLSVTATANPVSMTYGGTVPSPSGTLSVATGEPTSGLANLSVTWTTQVTSAISMGQYPVTPVFSYNGGSYSTDFNITDATSNSTAMTIVAKSSPISGGVTPTQIVPVVQTVQGFDNVVTPSEAPATTVSSGSSFSSSSSGNSTPLSSSGFSSLTIILPTDDGMTGEGIISYETVTPSKRP